VLAPRIAKSRTDTVSSSCNRPSSQGPGLCLRQSGIRPVQQSEMSYRAIGNQATLRLLAQRARLAAGNDSNGRGSASAESSSKCAFHASGPGADAGAGTQLPTFPRDYGGTDCNFPGGAVSTIYTSGCNKPCIELHESVHLRDIKPCCQEANIQYFLAGSAAEKAKVKTVWANWADSVRATLECRAYAVSNPCLDRAKKENKCDSDNLSPSQKECCGEIKLARDDGDYAEKKYCPSAAPTLLPCPFGPAGP
jgi:hypothetical protein